ncbi:hypothetical protein C0Q70_10076 [Pomacea canaliculata]|uniref:Uncharacterized protein n=1 Tax=Pomacea canaliculata TaxID=400727 RepID=A0A2T7PBL2_POMCA|nr:hypothetical protein C0Q70_10076 [Pomacea canaliculata]
MLPAHARAAGPWMAECGCAAREVQGGCSTSQHLAVHADSTLPEGQHTLPTCLVVGMVLELILRQVTCKQLHIEVVLGKR